MKLYSQGVLDIHIQKIEELESNLNEVSDYYFYEEQIKTIKTDKTLLEIVNLWQHSTTFIKTQILKSLRAIKVIEENFFTDKNLTLKVLS